MMPSIGSRFVKLSRKVSSYKWITDGLWLVAAVLSASFGLKGFLLPNHFLDGGAMGISLLFHHFSGIDLAVWVILVNLPFLVMSVRQISKGFALKTLFSILALALMLEVISFPLITDDKLLIAVFGGFFLGAGIGLAIRGGAVIDGTEVLALYLSRKGTLSIGEVIGVINLLIFLAAAILINVETALYAMLTYWVASKTVDFVVHGLEGYSAVWIISEHSEEIRQVITEQMGKGLTILKGKKGYQKTPHAHLDMEVLYTVVSRLEIVRLKNEIEQIDPKAFIIQQRVDDTKGGMIKRKIPNH